MSHVMFGGLTHEGAVRLCERLVEMSPAGLSRVFLSDSGSVAMEIAIKLALQYWQAEGAVGRTRLLTLRGGYHGDTFGAMAVCDPVTGMHGLFRDVLPQHLFAPRPSCRFGDVCDDAHLEGFAELLTAHRDELAAVVLEPVVQGAGGMWFYSPEYLARVAALCREADVLLVADEIATGFGRSGELFGCDHAGVSPDVMAVGKALTGGMLSMAATLVNDRVADALGRGEPGVFMHGPTFMGNPLACAAALASLDELEATPWRQRVKALEAPARRRARALSGAAPGGGRPHPGRHRSGGAARARGHGGGGAGLRRGRGLDPPLRRAGLHHAALHHRGRGRHAHHERDAQRHSRLLLGAPRAVLRRCATRPAPEGLAERAGIGEAQLARDLLDALVAAIQCPHGQLAAQRIDRGAVAGALLLQASPQAASAHVQELGRLLDTRAALRQARLHDAADAIHEAVLRRDALEQLACIALQQLGEPLVGAGQGLLEELALEDDAVARRAVADRHADQALVCVRVLRCRVGDA